MLLIGDEESRMKQLPLSASCTRATTWRIRFACRRSLHATSNIFKPTRPALVQRVKQSVFSVGS